MRYKLKDKEKPEVKKEILQRIKGLKQKLLRSTDTSKGCLNSNRTGFLEIIGVDFISK